MTTGHSDRNPPDVANHEQPPSPFFPLARPCGQLQQLPLRYRWEVTRRHPYYFNWWRHFGSRSESSNQTPEERTLSNCAFALLRQIQVSSADYPPSTEFEVIVRAHPIPDWMTKGIELQTYSNLAEILISCMPSNLLREVGQIMIAASSEIDGARVEALADLIRVRDPGIHSYTGEPIVSVSPHLSVRAMDEQLSQFLNECRGDGVPERRIRVDRFDDYFQVWDKREGWSRSEGEYLRERKSSLAEVARTLGISISTAGNRYCSAFQLITGHPYTLGNWVRIFGLNFWTVEEADAYQRAALRRRAGLPRASGPAPIPESRIAKGPETRRLTEQLEVSDRISEWEIEDDIRTLLRSGKNRERIADELELSIEVVQSIIDHMGM